MGWAAGFSAGSRAAGDALDTYYALKERKDLERAMGLTPQQTQEQISLRAATPEELSRAQAETAALAAQDAETFGLSPQDQTSYAPAMPQPGQQVGVYRYKVGNQTFDRQPTQADINTARYNAAADVVALRNPLEAQRMRLAATQEERAAKGFETEQQIRGLHLKDLQRQEKKTADFETGLAELNKQKFDKPEDRTAAILDLIEKTQGPAARMTLESQYTQTDLNKITLKAKQFEDGFRQSFTKGVDATMKWLDDQDPGFTLQRVGKQIIQTNVDGSRRVFAQGSDQEIMEQFAGHASPSNFLTLSKNIYDRQANAAHRAALLKIYGDKTLAGRIKETEEQLGRQLTEDEILSMSGVTAKAKAGGVLSSVVDQKKNDDGSYTAFDKNTGKALYNTYLGEAIPLGMSVDEYTNMKKLARDNKVGLQIGETESGNLALRFIGADGKPYTDVEAARYAKPTKPAAGGASEEPQPALPSPALVRNASALYLKNKINRKEPLTADEKLRAKELGLKID